MLPKTKEVLDLIANDELFKKYDIRFVGGTARSYLIKHRLSEDLDFATLELKPHQVEEIEEMINKYGGEKLEHNITMEEYTLNDGEEIDLIYVTDPKPYDWYRTKIEEFIHGVLLDELYSS